MSNRKLNIAPGLKLDPDYVGGGTFALLAKKGAGKTYAMRVLAEEFWAAKVPFVALDPMDAFWGLRTSADGQGEGIEVPIFGGPHGDAPLEKGGGKLMADLVIEEGLSMVLSTKHFGTRAAERQFAMEFLERLYRKNTELVHLLIDEADLFAPQKPNAGDQPLLAITENIVRRGRNNGIGVTMATQRPAVLNKDVLNQVDGLFVMRLIGPTDRNAIDAWIGEHGDTGQGREVKQTLPDLDTGEAWVWVPEQGVLEKTRIRKGRTFDSSPTRKRGSATREPRSFADVDMGAIESKMADTIERAKAEDPKELRKRIRDLEAELGKRPTEQVEVEKIVEVPVLANGAMEKLEEAIAAIEKPADEILAELRRVTATARGRTQDVAQPRPRTQRRTEPAATPPQGRRVERPAGVAASDAEGEAELGPGAQKMLEVLAQRYPMRLSQAQLCTLAGYRPPKRSSTTRAAFSQLRRGGYLEEAGQEIWLSEFGIEAAGDVPAPPSPAEVVDHWRGVLPPAARAFLDVLLEQGDDGFDSKDELAEVAGFAPPGQSSTTRAAFADLKRNGLMEDVGGVIRASEELLAAA